MVKQKPIKFLLPAILLIILIGGIMALAPVVINKDPENVVVSTNVTPRSNFLGEVFTFVLDIRYPSTRGILEPGDIAASFEPFTLLDKTIVEKRSGEVVISYVLQCLESSSCRGDKSYQTKAIILYFVDKYTKNIEEIRVLPEPFYISPQIDPSDDKFNIRYSDEPVVEDNFGFFVMMVLCGTLSILIGIFGFIRMLHFGNKTKIQAVDKPQQVETSAFLNRLKELDQLLRRGGKPRFVLTQGAGIISDYLDSLSRDEENEGLRRQLIALKEQIEIEAYREDEPSKQNAEEKLQAVVILLKLENREDNV